MRLFNSACLLGALFCLACGGLELTGDGLGPSFGEDSGSAASGVGTPAPRPSHRERASEPMRVRVPRSAGAVALCAADAATDLTADPKPLRKLRDRMRAEPGLRSWRVPGYVRSGTDRM